MTHLPACIAGSTYIVGEIFQLTELSGRKATLLICEDSVKQYSFVMRKTGTSNLRCEHPEETRR